MFLHRAAAFLFVLFSICWAASQSSAAHAATVCSATNGPLTLKANAVRESGISPLLVFFDATGTTDSSINDRTTTFQEVYYSWNFGDTGTSGTETWAYGSNPGHNSRNTATGGVAAHLYVTPGVDTAYVVTVTAHAGSNTASCQLEVSAYDPARGNGFSGSATTCVSASGMPVPGSGGCPAGAAVLQTSSLTTALDSAHIGSGKRVLFRCGDTFTQSAPTISGTTWSIGAYGGCENTQTNRPILRGAINMHASDGRVSDLDWESVGGTTAAVTVGVSTQITLSNLLSNGNDKSYYVQDGTQIGFIGLVQTGMKGDQGTYVNYAQNNCVSGNHTYNCGGTPSFVDVDYTAMLGGNYDGIGATTSGNGIETVRVSACRKCVFANNRFANANNVGATFKLHSGNYYATQCQWLGQYTELVEVSDNYFTGESGAQVVEVVAQNGVVDERISPHYA